MGRDDDTRPSACTHEALHRAACPNCGRMVDVDPCRGDGDETPATYYVIRACLGGITGDQPLYLSRVESRGGTWVPFLPEAWIFGTEPIARAALEAMPGDYRRACEIRRVIVTSERVS